MIDPPASGAWNMAVDEVLLQWSAAAGGCCWRFYRWQEPTLSLGYFQAYDARRGHASSEACPVVRRITGGGAILHDAELTYSFVVPAEHRLARVRRALYETVHGSLIEVLAESGVKATPCHRPSGSGPQEQPFLCFQRRSSGDVLVGTTKIAGSAQRRLRGAVLQHGSVLLERSGAAPELDALNNVAGTTIREDQLIEAWLEKLARGLALCWRNEPLYDAERRRAEALVQSKYGSVGWTKDRWR